MAVKAIPDGYHTATPYLIIDGAAEAIEFYKRAFGAVELFRMPRPDGKIAHAEIKIGDSPIMLGDECPQMGARAPQGEGATPIGLMLYLEDVDAVVARAVEAGGTLFRPVEDRFYGDRSGAVRDPFGHLWHVATHIEDVAPDEIERRAAAFMKQQQEQQPQTSAA